MDILRLSWIRRYGGWVSDGLPEDHNVQQMSGGCNIKLGLGSWAPKSWRGLPIVQVQLAHPQPKFFPDHNFTRCTTSHVILIGSKLLDVQCASFSAIATRFVNVLQYYVQIRDAKYIREPKQLLQSATLTCSSRLHRIINKVTWLLGCEKRLLLRSRNLRT